MKIKPVILFRILFVVYIMAVMYLCFGHFQPGNDIPRRLFGFPTDKVVHFLMFMPFVPLTYLSFYKGHGKIWRFILFMAAMFGAGCMVSGGIELVQGMTIYRSADILDFHADAFGLGIGVALTILTAAITRKV